jgi:hypothetical protein
MDPKLSAALEGLRDIHLPAPVSFWPLAPAAWALFALAVLTVVAAMWAIRRRRRSVRRVALHELRALEAAFQAAKVAETDRVELAISLTTLLRRVALVRVTRNGVGALHGEPWVAFLTEGTKDAARSPRVVRDLVQTAYGGERSAAGDPVEWLAFARSWIREVA